MEITGEGGLSVRSGRGENGGKSTGNKKHKCGYKIDRGRLRTVWEMEKPKNLYV